jgi:hypothetical protein
MRTHKILPVLALFSFALVGLECAPPVGGDDTGGDDTGATGTDDTGGTVGGFNGTVTGSIQVQLYDVDGDGEYVYKDWSVWDGNFPFGAIWVYAFNTDESTDDETFFANQSILTPSVDGDDYSMTFTASAANVRVGAQLDFYNDGIMGTSDPVGIYPDVVSVTDGSTAAGVDITILAYWNNAGGSGGSSGGGGCDGSGGGNGDGSSTISGDIVITEAYAAGDAVAMLMTTGLEGPVAWHWNTPEPSGGGAEGPYTMSVCASGTDYVLQGCWDSNFNSVVESDDKCGPYISEPDVDGNPITVGDENLTEHDIQIPLGDYSLDLVPFVNLSGSITHDDGAFSGGTVTVGALKYKPSGDFTAADIAEAAYDYVEFDTSSGETSLSYSLDVPSNTITYLLAWDNEDGDTLINESDEAVGSGSSDDNGRLPTGSSSQVIDINLARYAN